MSYASVHMEKYKQNAIRGIQIHNQRERKSRSNPDIDYERSPNNYDLHNEERVNFAAKIQSRIDALNFQKTIRKDAVYMCGIVVSSDQAFFKKLNNEQTKKFFSDSYDFLCELVGKENVISAVVHLDETTPHMHFMHVPITKDNRLSAKDIYTRTNLENLQTDYAVYMQERGYEILRGEHRGQGKARKHLDTPEFKEQMEALKLVKREVAELAAKLENLQAETATAANEKEKRQAEYQKLIKDLNEYTAAAEIAMTTQAYKANLPEPRLTNARRIYDEAMSKIKAQKEVLTIQEAVMLENKKLKAQNAALVNSRDAVQAKLKAQEESFAYKKNELTRDLNSSKEIRNWLQQENGRLASELKSKNEFITDPKVTLMYLAHRQAKEKQTEQLTAPEDSQQSQSPSEINPAKQRSSGFER